MFPTDKPNAIFAHPSGPGCIHGRETAAARMGLNMGLHVLIGAGSSNEVALLRARRCGSFPEFLPILAAVRWRTGV